MQHIRLNRMLDSQQSDNQDSIASSMKIIRYAVIIILMAPQFVFIVLHSIIKHNYGTLLSSIVKTNYGKELMEYFL